MAPIRSFKLLRPDQTIAAASKRLENSTIAQPGIPKFSRQHLAAQKKARQKRAFKGDATYKKRNQAVLV